MHLPSLDPTPTVQWTQMLIYTSPPSPNHCCRSVSSVLAPSAGAVRSYVSPWSLWLFLIFCRGCLQCCSLEQPLKCTLSSTHVTNRVNSPETISIQGEAGKLVDSCFCLWSFGQTLHRVPWDPKMSKVAVAAGSSITQFGLTALLKPGSLGSHSYKLQWQACVSGPDFWVTKTWTVWIYYFILSFKNPSGEL